METQTDRKLQDGARGRQGKRPGALLLTALLGAAFCLTPTDAGAASRSSKPNIIFILADDLGYGELGCYGQKKIRTPNLDRLAAEGIRFTQHYAGSSVCAPTRCTLLTGKHTGHSYIRDNGELPTEGQRPLPAGTITIGHHLQRAGYTTAVIGKWGLGGPGSSGEPNQQGFDHWFGYLCQRLAHNYYPEYLWRNGRKVLLPGNEGGKQLVGRHYSHDLLVQEALQFIGDHRERPFFLYLPFTIPHLALQVPEDSLAEYRGQFPETPYDGGRGYLPHATPHAAYAAMITRMDRDIGRILQRLKTSKLERRTLVLFSSDNGPAFSIGGANAKFFNSAGPLRGLKQDLYEGGIRVPLIARWPGRIKPGTTSAHVSALWDVLPTLCEVAGVPAPRDTDGISFLPALLGRRAQARHDYLYWEYPSQGGRMAVRMGDWKLVKYEIRNGRRPSELYHLARDISEAHNVAAEHPEIVAQLEAVTRLRTPSHHPPWNY